VELTNSKKLVVKLALAGSGKCEVFLIVLQAHVVYVISKVDLIKYILSRSVLNR